MQEPKRASWGCGRKGRRILATVATSLAVLGPVAPVARADLNVVPQVQTMQPARSSWG